jgi:hypothetical protein
VHTNAISSISKFPTVFVVADGLSASFEGIPGDASIPGRPLRLGVDTSQDDIADRLTGDVPESSDCLLVLGNLDMANSHRMERFIQPEQAGFSSSHCYAVFSKFS